MSIRNKTFIIGLIMAPVLFGGGFLGLALMNAQTDIADRHVAILDRTGRAAAAIIQAGQERNKKELFNKKTGKQESPRYVFACPEETLNIRQLYKRQITTALSKKQYRK